MLAELRLRGFYLIPGVPNTTHVTQVTDRNYGQFKSVYRKSLSILTQECINMKKTIKPIDIPLLIFGREQRPKLQNAFEHAFEFDQNLKIWATIGISPFTRNYLNHEKVKHEVVIEVDGTIDIDSDRLSTKLISIEDLNRKATNLLDMNSLKGDVLRKSAPRQDLSRRNTAVTVAQSRERQDLLMNASTAGGRFQATGNDFLNSDDFFIS